MRLFTPLTLLKDGTRNGVGLRLHSSLVDVLWPEQKWTDIRCFQIHRSGSGF